MTAPSLTARCVEAAARAGAWWRGESYDTSSHNTQREYCRQQAAACHAFLLALQSETDRPQGYGHGEVNTRLGMVIRELREMMHGSATLAQSAEPQEKRDD